MIPFKYIHFILMNPQSKINMKKRKYEKSYIFSSSSPFKNPGGCFNSSVIDLLTQRVTDWVGTLDRNGGGGG
jgi:hypothetical protein